MKRYLLKIPALALLFVAISCQKDPQIDGVSDRGMAEVNVSLDGMSINESSRGTVPDITSLETYGFTIAGYHTVGTFKDNLTTVKPNLFNHTGAGAEDDGDAVVDLNKSTDGRFHVHLSKWRLDAANFLSYTAWSANTTRGTEAYPIKSATSNTSAEGQHFIEVDGGDNIDVVAAKSIDNKNDVVRGAIDLDFKHVLSKLKFNIVNSTGVTVKITGDASFSAKISRRGKYSFTGDDKELGTWGGLLGVSDLTFPVTPPATAEISSGATVALHELLVIPQKLVKGAISITLIYSLVTDITTINYKRTVQLGAQELVQNTSYTYDLIIEENQIKINEGRIGSWTVIENSSLPIIAGPRDGVTLLLLDAYDAPYVIGTKRYWLDRSGYNNHCELNSSGVTYDATDKSYHFDGNSSSYGILPSNAFVNIQQMSVETIAKRDATPNGNEQNIFRFVTTVSGKEARTMFMHFGYSKDYHLYFDASGGEMPLSGSGDAQFARIDDILPTEWLSTYAMYSFFKSETLQVMNRNLGYTHSAANANGLKVGTSTNNKIGNQFSGNIKYLKVKVYATGGVSYIPRADYDRLSKRHRIPADDYVKDGLLLDLRGGDALVSGVWKNRAVPGKYDAIQRGNITYNAEKKYYQIRTPESGGLTQTLSGSDYFEIPKGMPDVSLETHTIELVLKSHSGAHDCLMILTSNASERGIFYSSYYSDAKIRYQAPTKAVSGSPMLLTVENNPVSNNPFGTTEIRSHVLKRVQTTNTVMSVYANGTDQPLATQTFTSATQVGAINNIQIGRGGVWISAIRIYNRELNNKERVHNYFVDKSLYDIP